MCLPRLSIIIAVHGLVYMYVTSSFLTYILSSGNETTWHENAEIDVTFSDLTEWSRLTSLDLFQCAGDTMNWYELYTIWTLGAISCPLYILAVDKNTYDSNILANWRILVYKHYS